MNEASQQAKSELLRTIAFSFYNGLAAVCVAELVFYLVMDRFPRDLSYAEVAILFVIGCFFGLINYLAIGKRWIKHGKQGIRQGRQED